MITRKQSVTPASVIAATITGDISLGTGIFEMQVMEVSVSRSYAVQSLITIQYGEPTEYTYSHVARGYCTSVPLEMPFRRLVQGPCTLRAQSHELEAGTIQTFRVAYRRVE